MVTNTVPTPYAYAMFPLQETIFDKDTGEPLANGIVTFFSDYNQTVRKDVWQQSVAPGNVITYTNLGSQLILSGIGTFVDGDGNNIIPFLYPYENGDPNTPDPSIIQLYFIQVTAAVPPIGSGAAQFTVNDWPPNVSSSQNDFANFETSGNIITNPQFSVVSFYPATGGFTLTVSGTGIINNIAPGWDIVTTGTGTVIVQQIPITAIQPTNMPYTLDVQVSAGVTSCVVQQTIYQSPRIFANQYVCGSFVAASQDSIAHTLTMSYTPSNTGTPQVIVSKATATDDSFTDFAATVQITNTSALSPATGYVTVGVSIPVSSRVQISSIQLTSVFDASALVGWIELSTPDLLNGLFNNYYPSLGFKPIPSRLTGWDFPLNPKQFGVSGTITTPAYICDQTIASATTSVSWAVNSSTQGLNFSWSDTNQAFYILQYLSDANAKKMLLSYLSSNVNAYCTVATGVTMLVSMFAAPAAGGIVPLPGNFVTLGTDGSVTLTAAAVIAGWTVIPQPNKPQPTAPLTLLDADYGFSGWHANPSQVLDTNFYAIVVSFAYTNASAQLTVNSVSVTPGLIPTRPGAQSIAQVLQECEYYYESTGAVSGDLNALFFSMSANSVPSSAFAQVYASPFTLDYKVTKRVAPSLTFYSRAGTAANFSAYLYYPLTSTNAFTISGPTDVAIASFWTGVNGVYCINFAPISISTLIFVSNSSSSSNFSYASGGVKFQYIADARLGIV